MKIDQLIGSAKTIGISSHIRPDGDAIGSSLGMYLYLKKNYPETKVDVFLEKVLPELTFISGSDEVKTDFTSDVESYDLFIVLDCSKDRTGDAEKFFDAAKKTINIDHHVSNHGYGQVNIIETPLSSACELIATLMAEEDIDKDIASAIYTGMVTDSGGFRFSATSRKTMNIAGMLMEKGIDHAFIMDRCMYSRTYNQAQLLGRALLESMLVMDGKCIITTVTKKMMDIYECLEEDTEGIVDQLRVTRGVEVAVFLRERGEQEYKVSLRSNSYIDVSRVAEYFDGGGHIRAAGFTMRGSIHDIVNNIMEQINLQM